jgi:N-methylhydantoinase B
MISPAGLDVITTEIIRSALVAASDEMAKTLIRTACNPVLDDVKDFGVALLSSEGELWSEAPGCAIFSRTLPSTIRDGLERLGVAGFSPGDVLIANDPYATGTHVADTTIYMPVFADGQLFAFAGTTAHWVDVGGATTGGVNPFSRDVYQEGLCFRHQKLATAGRRNTDLIELIEQNVRVPQIARGDMNAQIAACLQGLQRVQSLCEKYSAPVVSAAMARVISQTDRAMRARIRELPDGRYGASIKLDAIPENGDGSLTLCVQLEVAGEQIHVSFAGTSPSARGPVNLPSVGARAQVSAVVRSLLLPEDATNEGHVKALTFDIPPGLIVSPQRPTPADCYAFVGECLFEMTIRALAGVVPQRCPAGGFQLCGVGLMRTDPRDGKPFVLMEPLVGGNGGHPHEDGATMMFVGNGDVPNLPTEVLEVRYPVRVERYELLPEVAGIGKYRGGSGLRKDYRILEDGIYLVTGTDNAEDPTARGLHGGADGAPNVVICHPHSDRETVLSQRVAGFGPFHRADLISVRSGGGGGWGPARERDPALVARDVRDELLTPQQALEQYGVSVSPPELA